MLVMSGALRALGERCFETNFERLLHDLALHQLGVTQQLCGVGLCRVSRSAILQDRFQFFENHDQNDTGSRTLSAGHSAETMLVWLNRSGEQLLEEA